MRKELKTLYILAISFLAFGIGCTTVDILERRDALVLEKQMTVTHDGLDGTKRYCRLLLRLDNGTRLSLEGEHYTGATPYDLCQHIQENDTVHIVRYQEWGWYLANTKY